MDEIIVNARLLSNLKISVSRIEHVFLERSLGIISEEQCNLYIRLKLLELQDFIGVCLNDINDLRYERVK